LVGGPLAPVARAGLLPRDGRAYASVVAVFWADVVGRPVSSFARPTLKRHRPATDRRNVVEGYRGCVAVY
jgi:hypothetical protein